MADGTLLFRPQRGKIATVEFDAVVSETHTTSNEITEHPVEKGAKPSDHSRPLPDRVTMEVIVSNASLDGEARAAGFAESVYEQLLTLQKSGEIVSVTTTKRLYDSMEIESTSRTVDARWSDALKITLNLKTIRVVENRLTRVVEATDKRAKRKSKGGKVPTTETTPEKKKSALVQIGESATNLSQSNNGMLRGLGGFASTTLAGDSGNQSLP